MPQICWKRSNLTTYHPGSLTDIAPEKLHVEKEAGSSSNHHFSGAYVKLLGSICQVSSVQNPGWLFDIGDYTIQLYGDYKKNNIM